MAESKLETFHITLHLQPPSLKNSGILIYAWELWGTMGRSAFHSARWSHSFPVATGQRSFIHREDVPKPLFSGNALKELVRSNGEQEVGVNERCKIMFFTQSSAPRGFWFLIHVVRTKNQASFASDLAAFLPGPEVTSGVSLIPSPSLCLLSGLVKWRYLLWLQTSRLSPLHLSLYPQGLLGLSRLCPPILRCQLPRIFCQLGLFDRKQQKLTLAKQNDDGKAGEPGPRKDSSRGGSGDLGNRVREPTPGVNQLPPFPVHVLPFRIPRREKTGLFGWQSHQDCTR